MQAIEFIIEDHQDVTDFLGRRVVEEDYRTASEIVEGFDTTGHVGGVAIIEDNDPVDISGFVHAILYPESGIQEGPLPSGYEWSSEHAIVESA